MRFSPQQGTACVFYTSTREGGVDAASFHFGQAVRGHGAGKWTLQFFKERPAEARTPDGRRRFAEHVYPLASDAPIVLH